MSLEDIRSECSEIAGLLQPYVDGEVHDDDQEEVAKHLQRCQGCRAAVSEQAWVRTTLQSAHRERAPQALRARIQLGLDQVDGDHERQPHAQPAPPGLGARMWGRLRDLGKGGLIMVPAGAVAVGLFFVARDAPELTAGLVGNNAPMIGGALISGADAHVRAHSGANAAPMPAATQDNATQELKDDIDQDLLRLVRAMEPSVGFGVQIPAGVRRRPGESSPIQLVGASVDREDPNTHASVRLRYALRSRGHATGRHLLDRQQDAGSFDAPGQLLSVGGRQYRLHRDGAGVPVVYFRFRNIVHAVTLEGAGEMPPRARDEPRLPEGTPAEYGPLLRGAEQLRALSSRPPPSSSAPPPSPSPPASAGTPGR